MIKQKRLLTIRLLYSDAYKGMTYSKRYTIAFLVFLKEARLTYNVARRDAKDVLYVAQSRFMLPV